MDEDRFVAIILGSFFGCMLGAAVAYTIGIRLGAGMLGGAILGRFGLEFVMRAASRPAGRATCPHCGHVAANSEADFCASCNRSLSGLGV
jgi:hypothetical protein